MDCPGIQYSCRAWKAGRCRSKAFFVLFFWTNMEKSRFWCHSGLLWRYHGRKRRKWTGGQRERERMFMKLLDGKALELAF